MQTRARMAPWCLACGIFFVGCTGPAQTRYEQSLEGTPEAAAHGVHEERLATLMRDLDRLKDERLPKALDPREEASHRTREVSRVAAAMAESAVKIPAAEPTNLAVEERAAYRALALTLQKLCEQLAVEAPHLSAAERRSQLAEIDATCNGCHTRFRIPGVVHGDD